MRLTYLQGQRDPARGVNVTELLMIKMRSVKVNGHKNSGMVNRFSPEPENKNSLDFQIDFLLWNFRIIHGFLGASLTLGL